MSNSAIYGILILFGAVALLILFMLHKREQDYKIAMEKYERDMEAYNNAVALYGDPSFAASVPTAAASVAVPVTSVSPVVTAPATSSGEVLLSGVDEPTAAMIIAILCNELGQNPAALRFKSITAM
ncbi:MAG: hypothetical protein K0S22_1341 [Oscillospiraceae bacterium]|jgi:hypothetical protein|nr:hypothetical protein [Oscillospiraceae bacterium]